MRSKHNQSGFIKLIATIIIIVVILTVLNVDIRSIIDSELFQKNLDSVVDLGGQIISKIQEFWVKYGHEPASYIWQNWLQPSWAKLISWWQK